MVAALSLSSRLLEELELAEVLPEVRRLLPRLMRARTSSTEATSVSVSPTTTTLMAQLSQVREETSLIDQFGHIDYYE